MMISDVAQPGILLQLPWLMGVDKHTVTPVTCAFGVHVFGVRVARTDLAPPGMMTSSGDVSTYWQSAAPEDPSAGEPEANAVLPRIADRRAADITADVNNERRTVIPPF
jgi:hypothetical protein